MIKFQMNRSAVVLTRSIAVAFLALAVGRISAQTNDSGTNEFVFIAAGDMRGYIQSQSGGKRYFDGLCEAARRVGAGAFMMSPGDCDPPAPIRATIDRFIGTNYVWYPVIGNHDAKDPASMAWLRHWAEAGIPHLVQHGPPGAELTSYSFDFGCSHFVALNEYYDGKADNVGKGDVPDAALAWLEADLAATKKPLIWVIGHKPIKTIPDMDSGRTRHGEDSVSADAAHRDRLVQLLKQYHVRAYICGHTHNTSVTKVDGVWQADSGHARGAGDPGAPSTFLKFHASSERAWVDIYRSDASGEKYQLRKTVELN